MEGVLNIGYIFLRKGAVAPVLLLMSIVPVSGCERLPVHVPEKYMRISCPSIPVMTANWSRGFAQRPETAGSIARAIISEIKSPKELRGIGYVKVKDEGSAWGVYTSNKGVKFGGGVSMKIDKCSSIVYKITMYE